MTRRKTRTEQAIENKLIARQERTYHPGVNLAGMYERKAKELLATDGAPNIGPGGELIEPSIGLPTSRYMIRETLREGCDVVAEDASVARTSLLLQPSFNAVAIGVDAAQAIDAANSLEKMLAHQMAVAHEAAMRLMDRALSYEAGGRTMKAGDSTEACRLANTSARLMSVYQDALLTLQRLRSGGNQTVTVQHVNVQSGAQAVIGNVTRGSKRRG